MDTAGFEQVPPRYFWRRIFAFAVDYILVAKLGPVDIRGFHFV
jgi:hypothetical protein